MAITKDQFNQLGIELFHLPASPGYPERWLAGQNGIMHELDPNTAQYLSSLGVSYADNSHLNNYSTSGGNTVDLNYLNNAVNQVASKQQQTSQVTQAQQLNQAISSGNTSEVERLSPGYTLYNGAFVQKSQIPSLTGSSVQNGNVVGTPLTRTLADIVPTKTDQVSRDAQGNFFLNGQHITLDQFKQLGINADFVQPGQSVSLSQATLGHEGGLPQVTQQILDGMKAKGLTLNPNVPITPQTAQEFLSFAANNIGSFLGQAQKEIAPYYATQLKLAADSLGKSLGYNEEQLAQNEKDLQTRYSDTLKQIGVTSADQGFAQSGIRKLQEQNLATITQNDINQGRRNLAYNAGNAVASFAQRYGSTNLPNVGSSSMPRVLAGESNFDTSGPPSPFYQLSPDVYNGLTGSEQFAETSAEQQRASQLEGLYNQQNTLSRTLPT